MDVTFTWDKSEGEGVAGYKIYYKADYCCYPYNGTHPINTDLDSPITVLTEDLADPDNPEYTLTGLDSSKNYFCVATTYYNDGSESGFSNEESTDDFEDSITTSPVSGGGCFIATAVYGSPMSSKVKILCQFRDRCLLTNSIGRDIVDAYYKFSPPVADYLHKHPFARAIVRYALVPIIGIAYVSLYIHPLALLFAFFFMLLAGIYCARRLSRQRNNSIL